MANKGKKCGLFFPTLSPHSDLPFPHSTNGSQWFVSLRPCPHLAGKHVVFGRVVKGSFIKSPSLDDETDLKFVQVTRSSPR